MSNHTFSKAEDATYRAYLYQERRDDFHIGIVLFARKSELYSGLYQFYTIVALMFLLLIPLFGYVVYFIRRNIQHPIDRMLRASGRMEAGEMGITVEGDMPNQEFMQMKESFDSMSAQVKYLFDSMYSESLRARTHRFRRFRHRSIRISEQYVRDDELAGTDVGRYGCV